MKQVPSGPMALPGNGRTNCATHDRTSTRSPTDNALMRPGEIYLAQFPFGDVPGEKTRPTTVQIGERKKPVPNAQPGFLRIDTVHQGDSPEGKGIYHINAVDEITQWEVVLATPRISEAWRMPLLESILQQFPFVILNFHSDHGTQSRTPSS